MTIEGSLRGLIYLTNAYLVLVFGSAWALDPIAHLLGLDSGLNLHLTMASIGVLLSFFSDTCVLFYFIGTAVWMRDRAKEHVIADRNAALRAWDIFERANKLKAKTFPFATMGISFAMFTFVLGGANQVGAIPRWLHPTLATLLLVNSLSAIRFYMRGIQQNLAYLDEVSSILGLNQPDDAKES